MGWVVIALLVGCSSKEERVLLASFQKTDAYHKHLQRTEKAELFDGNTSVAFITATHLYTANNDKNDTRDEVFIIGVQFEDNDNARMTLDKNETLTNDNDYILTLNKNHAIKVIPLSHDDIRLKEFSFVTSWGKYYELTYPHAKVRFSLVFSNARYGDKALIFSKIPKFVYTKKGF